MDRKSKKNIFDKWYHNSGKIYQFIYRCNYSVTDIQYRELLELLRMHCRLIEKSGKLFFTTREKMENFLWEFRTKLFQETSYKGGKKVRNFCLKKIDHTIVIENYFTSSLVYIPDSIEIDIEEIIYEAGYAFVCGENLFCERIDTATYKDVKRAVDCYRKGLKYPLKFDIFDEKKYPYTDRGYEDDFKNNGADLLCLDSKHYYLQELPLMEAIKKLNDLYSGEGKEAKEVFILKDSSMPGCNSEEPKQGYYFLIHPLVINKNLCYLFDTDHPAWNNTLIPHTFVSAMINIVRASSYNKMIKMVDPLVGSGTIAVEAAKYPDILFMGGDIKADSYEKIRYNMDFFAMDYEKAKILSLSILQYLKENAGIEYERFYIGLSERQKKRIIQLINSADEEDKRQYEEIELLVKWLLREHMEVFEQNEQRHEYQLQKVISTIHTSERNKKNIYFFAYLYRKIYLKHFQHTETISPVSFKEKIYAELKSMFFRVLDMTDILKAQKGQCSTNSDTGKIVFVKDKIKYIGVRYGQQYKNDLKENIYDNIDMRDFLANIRNKGEKPDVIITDPPYGYNTDEQDDQLFELYRDLAIECTKTIGHGGQVIICLAEQMHLGKRLPAFIKKETVMDMFLDAAEQNDLYVVNCDEEIYDMDQLYCFPFFWEAKKALKRQVIRLQFFEKSKMKSCCSPERLGLLSM